MICDVKPVGRSAKETGGIIAKVYLSTMRASTAGKIWDALREAGEPVPDWQEDEERGRRALESEERITTTIDIRPVLEASGRRCSRTAARSTTRGSARSRRRWPSRRSATSTSSAWSTRPAPDPGDRPGSEPGHNRLVAASGRSSRLLAVAAAVAELYGADPDVFTERRKALAAAAKEAGDRAAASAIGALRKPTRAAWVME